ncbi:MAG TPA: EamA family transporter [Alcaligenaceae bacterium]|nr:EamA family transporter [Alcaligenaceae bacterium]
MSLSNSHSPRTVLLPVLSLLAAILSLCVGTSFAKSLFPEVGAAGTTTYRLVLGALILVIWQRPWRWALDANAAFRIFLYAASLGLMNLVFYMSLRTLPLGISIALELAGPLTLSIVLSRKAIDFLWIFFALFGLSLLLPITDLGSELDPLGVIYALAGGMFWVLYILFGKRLGGLPSGQSTSLGLVMAALCVLPFGIAEAGVKLIDPVYLVAGLGVGILSSALPYSLEMNALKGLSAKTFGMMLSMEPAIGALTAAVLLQEHLDRMQWVAILCIIIAAAGCAATATRKT